MALLLHNTLCYEVWVWTISNKTGIAIVRLFVFVFLFFTHIGFSKTPRFSLSRCNLSLQDLVRTLDPEELLRNTAGNESATKNLDNHLKSFVEGDLSLYSGEPDLPNFGLPERIVIYKSLMESLEDPKLFKQEAVVERVKEILTELPSLFEQIYQLGKKSHTFRSLPGVENHEYDQFLALKSTWSQKFIELSRLRIFLKYENPVELNMPLEKALERVAGGREKVIREVLIRFHLQNYRFVATSFRRQSDGTLVPVFVISRVNYRQLDFVEGLPSSEEIIWQLIIKRLGNVFKDLQMNSGYELHFIAPKGVSSHSVDVLKKMGFTYVHGVLDESL
jgi:hypothetical protein